MATAPTQEEIDAYNPPVNDGPPNHPYVSVYQYRKKLSEMGFGDAKPDDIQKVAVELGIPFTYAFQLQHTLDKIKNNAQVAHDAFQITSGTSKRTQHYKGGRKSRRYSKKSGRKSRRHGKKSRRHGKKCRR